MQQPDSADNQILTVVKLFLFISLFIFHFPSYQLELRWEEVKQLEWAVFKAAESRR